MSTIVLATLWLALAGCSEADFAPVSIDEGDVILAFGDSLTRGVGASQGNAYPDVFASLSGRRVVNAGVSGEETAGGLRRLPGILQQHQPALVILMEGGNDILRNQDPGRTQANLARMIQLSTDAGAVTVLIGVPEKNLFYSTAPIYEELAEAHQVIYVDDLLSALLRQSKYRADLIHLNDAGYRRFAEQLYDILRENGVL
ncbi:MAG: GDSL-type esterase/lipase family protein [bacterium]